MRKEIIRRVVKTREKAVESGEVAKLHSEIDELTYDIRIKLNIFPFRAVTFEGVKDIVFSWSVDKNKGTKYYLEAVMDFYTSLKSGGFERECSEPYAILMQTGLRNEQGFKTADLEHALEHHKALAQRYSTREFYSLHAFTPYCLISLEGNGKIWTPEDGMIYVVSSQNLSKPLSTFMRETSDALEGQHDRSALEHQLQDTYKKLKHIKS